MTKPRTAAVDHVAGIAALARQHGELAAASGEVISRRLELAASPGALTPDGQAELARMVPEKAHAFSRAGNEALFHFNAIWLRAASDWLREVSLATTTTAQVLTARDPVQALAAQQTYLAGLAERMSESGHNLFAATTALQSAALAPVHRTATANARRLKR